MSLSKRRFLQTSATGAVGTSAALWTPPSLAAGRQAVAPSDRPRRGRPPERMPSMRRCRQPLSRMLAAVCLAVAATAPAPSAQSPREALIEFERGWNDAFYRQDVDFIEGLLADEFIATYDDGSRGDKARELELVASFNQQVVSAVQEDFTIEFFENTAVVRFTLRIVGIRQGREAEIQLSYTDVWVLRDGRWQCVSTHSTRIS